MAVDVRYLPGQDPGEILAQVRADPRDRRHADVHPSAGDGLAHRPVRAGAARCRVARSLPIGEVMSVGRDGASDAAAFIEAGIPAVEFGPAGAGHHGPEEWVSLSSLARYRRALGDFVRALPMWLERAPPRTDAGLRAIEGGLAAMRLIPNTPRRGAVAVRARRRDRDRVHGHHDRRGRTAPVQAARGRHRRRTPAIKHASVTIADPGQSADDAADRLRPPRRRRRSTRPTRTR